MTAYDDTPRRGKRSARRRIFGLLLLGLLILALFALDYGVRLLQAPWSLGGGSSPTLTGDWLGKITLVDGTTGSMFMTLGQYFSGNEGYGGNNLQGTARYCLGSYSADMEVYGAADRRGTITELRFRNMEDNPVWLVNNASGSWAGETLTVKATYSFDPTAEHIVRSDQPSPELTIAFHPGRAEDFQAACTSP